MKELIPNITLGFAGGVVLLAGLFPAPTKEPDLPPLNERVMESTPLQVRDDAPEANVPTSVTTAEAHDAVDPEAVSFELQAQAPSAVAEVRAQTCATCASAVSYAPAYAAPVPAGRWISVPVYGRFGRYQGRQWQWQPYR